MVDIDENVFIEKKAPLILECLWHSIRVLVSKNINLKDTPELMRLVEDKEEPHDLLKLNVDHILIRWINYHLKKAG